MKIVACLLLGFLLFSSLAFAFKAGKGQEYYFSCASSSMSPTFDCNSTLEARYPDTDSERYNMTNGTVIWFSTWQFNSTLWAKYHLPLYIIHRIVGKDYDKQGIYYITAGDNHETNLMTDYEAWNLKVRPHWILFKIIAP